MLELVHWMDALIRSEKRILLLLVPKTNQRGRRWASLLLSQNSSGRLRVLDLACEMLALWA